MPGYRSEPGAAGNRPGCSNRVFWSTGGHEVYVLRGAALELLPERSSLIPQCRGKYLATVVIVGLSDVEEWDLETMQQLLRTRGSYVDFWPGAAR